MKLEINATHVNKTPKLKAPAGQVLMLTPPIDEDYWLFRVRLGKKGQAIIGFHKFSTIGIGFAKEEDWNTNLPYTSSAKDIFRHIKHNKADKSISDAECLQAIELIREAAESYVEQMRRKAKP